MKRQYGRAIIVIMFLVSIGIIMNAAVTAADYNKAPVLVGYLSVDHLDPKPAISAQGKIVFMLSDDGSQLYYKLSVATGEKPTAAHIYLAPDGENGRAVVTLFDLKEFPQTGSFDGKTSEGIITADKLIGPLVGSTLHSLLREMGDGDTFVSVLTEKYPQGLIRGRIVDPQSFGN